MSKQKSNRLATPRRATAGLAALLLVCLPAALPAQQRSVEPMPSLAPMVARVSPAVVNISVSGSIAISNPLAEDPLFRRFFELPPESRRDFQSVGSGVIVDAERGYILTNHHVVENAEDITITLHDNRTMEARIVGSDAASDLAVLQVGTDHLTQITLAEPDSLLVGDYVVAIGNPFGYSNTVTSGIVSALGRTNVNPDRNAYQNFIQTDASINPGNSGGALVNLQGELVGINSAILSRGGGNIGIGFAIPIEMVSNVMDQLIEFGTVSRGLLGVSIVSVMPDVAEVYGLGERSSGALVTDVVPHSAAEQAGIQIGDVIVSVNGEEVRDSGALRSAIGLLRPGDEVEVGIVRDGRARKVTATLNRLDEESGMPAVEERQLAELDPVFEGAEIVNNSSGLDGLLVARVERDSPAYQRGLREGDIITHVNRQRVRTAADAQPIIADARSVILQVQRGRRGLLILMR